MAEQEKNKISSDNLTSEPAGSVSIVAEIKKKLQEVPKDQQKSYLELLVNRIIKQAVVDGDEQMIIQIWSCIDGPPEPEAPASSVDHLDIFNEK